MVVKTRFSKEGLRKILSYYNLGEYKSHEYFSHGWVQTTILLYTTKGKYVLRYYETNLVRKATFEIKLMTYLKSKNYQVPKIIKNSFGKQMGKYNGKPFIVLEYIDGKSAKNLKDISKPKQLIQILKIITRLHILTEKYRPKYIKEHDIFDIKYILKKYKEISRTENQKKYEWLKGELSKLKFPSNLPKGMCHADINYSNFLFRKGKLVGVVDFDKSHYTYFIYDIASMIYWWALYPKNAFNSKCFNSKKAKNIIKEYSKYRKLSISEKNHIYDALKLIILLGISWSGDSDFEPNKRIVEYFNNVGREKFYKKIF